MKGIVNMQPKQVEAIKRFLETNTHPDLALLYNQNMEVQITVLKLNGNRIDQEYKGKSFHKYTDGINTWGPIRIPYKANTEPEYDLDKVMTWDLSVYAEGIGLTGWEWTNKLSRWVVFDFDALTGHSEKHTKRLTNEELEHINNTVQHIPWITIRKSTSGNGLHLYVFIDPPVSTANHAEHAALARSILNKLSTLCNHDFASQCDGSGGGNFWIWHRKMYNSDNTFRGLQLIKQGIPLTDIPSNWQDFIPVVLGKQHRSLLPGPNVDELAGQRNRIKLDKEHTRLLDYLSQSRFISHFDSERWMLVTHSYAIKEAYKDLALKGIYDTLSPGTDPSSPNAFAFPLSHGVWIVRRFTPEIAETNTWEKDSKGFLRCYINREPTLDIIAKLNEGKEHKSGGYVFDSTINLIATLKSLGFNQTVPTGYDNQPARLKKIKDGKLLAEIKYDDKHSLLKLNEWYLEKGWWGKVFDKRQTDNEIVTYDQDDVVRHLISSDNIDAGWVVKSSINKTWNQEPWLHIKALLEGKYGYDNRQLKTFLGSNVDQPWIIVNEPFQPEYLDNRRWNRNAAQLKYVPTPNLDSLEHPTWNIILDHCGKSLNNTLKNNTWAKENNILTGADYLKVWVASCFKQPYEPLPYLFFYGPENSGKSIFHEALALLITRGYVRADNTLKSNSGFNGELEGALFAVIEETNLKADKVANQRVKDWVTSVNLPIHPKHRTPYTVANSTHWIQSSNDASFCPIFVGDTRITVIEVYPIEQEIPKRVMLQTLEREAPDFIASILNTILPPITGRLAIPVIETADKRVVEASNRNPVEEFFEDQTYYYPGKAILYSELFQYFRKGLDGQESAAWSIRKFGQHLPSKFIKGRIHGIDPNWHIGNISLTEPTVEELKQPKYILVGQYLELESND